MLLVDLRRLLFNNGLIKLCLNVFWYLLWVKLSRWYFFQFWVHNNSLNSCRLSLFLIIIIIIIIIVLIVYFNSLNCNRMNRERLWLRDIDNLFSFNNNSLCFAFLYSGDNGLFLSDFRSEGMVSGKVQMFSRLYFISNLFNWALFNCSDYSFHLLDSFRFSVVSC